MNDAKKQIESEGFKVLSLVDGNDGNYVFLCENDNGVQIEVGVIDGEIMISPT